MKRCVQRSIRQRSSGTSGVKSANLQAVALAIYQQCQDDRFSRTGRPLSDGVFHGVSPRGYMLTIVSPSPSQVEIVLSGPRRIAYSPGAMVKRGSASAGHASARRINGCGWTISTRPAWPSSRRASLRTTAPALRALSSFAALSEALRVEWASPHHPITPSPHHPFMHSPLKTPCHLGTLAPLTPTHWQHRHPPSRQKTHLTP